MHAMRTGAVHHSALVLQPLHTRTYRKALAAADAHPNAAAAQASGKGRESMLNSRLWLCVGSVPCSRTA